MMITWQAQGQQPENAKNLGTIAKWWKSLNTKSILWKQRMIPKTGEIDWAPQRFDESFLCWLPDLRGMTLYWKKGEEEQERNITASKLEFNTTRQHLLIYPEKRADVVISIEVPGVTPETLRMKNPAWSSEKIVGADNAVTGYRLTIQDEANLVEVQVEMDATSLNFLRNTLSGL